MRLATFIDQNQEAILEEWERFARTIDAPGKELNPETLRDHAGEILRTVVVDLRSRQSAHEQIEKSKGHGQHASMETAAETHAVTRLLSGFTMDQMVSEYRALRASVLKLWMAENRGGADSVIDDVMRFNEAIDQALTESIAGYSRAVEAAQTIFLGVLGHDLRSPLAAIGMGIETLERTARLEGRSLEISAMIQSSVKRSARVIGDLLDFTRSQQASGIPIKRQETDLSPLCRTIVDEVRAAYPTAHIRLEGCEGATGWFDGARMEQVFCNLIANAVHHGDQESEILVTLATRDDQILFTVHNLGKPIAEEDLPFIFNPMGRFSEHSQEDFGPIAGLGLGLFIASQIINAHHGTIDVTSGAQEGTQFVMTLPRAADPQG